MLQFEHIEFLYGLLVLLPLTALFLVVLRWKRKSMQKLGEVRLVKPLLNRYSPFKYNLKIILVLLAIALGIGTIANLRQPQKGKGSKGSGIDVMIALDVSKSMWSQDEKPTRLEKAKLFINTLNQQLNNNRIGLVVFAGQAYLQMPLTADAGAARMYVNNASPDMVPQQGTDISSALQLCDASLDTKEKKYKAIVLITDGEDHDPNAIKTVQDLTEHGTVLHTIGVGSVEGSPITEPGTNEYKKDDNGQTIISKLNEGLLKELAQKGNGSYHLLTDVSSVTNAVADDLNGMDKKMIEGNTGSITYNSFYLWFLVPALVLLVIELFISEKKKLQTT
ncbi:MAG: VWA domain-containing protein [Bacteroidota bacterium]|nr:VWA domain-containing protein [Bacteroidota bacterium]